MIAAESLTGRPILLIEDEYFIADDMVKQFERCGAKVVGPVASVGDALKLIENTLHIEGAVLDLNLQGEMAYAVADALTARQVPFVFATGYDANSIPPLYGKIVRCEKPVGPEKVADALFRQIK